jgi:Flp pilus assembly protein TadD
MKPDGRQQIWSWLMRMSPAFMCAAAALVTLSAAAPWTSVAAQAVNPVSTALQNEADRAVAAGNADQARGLYETALVADPRNAAAYVGLGRIALTQQLPGQAIAHFRSALMISPNSRAALAGQGVALVARGAVDRARSNLVRLQTLCGGDACPEARELAAAINGAGSQTVLRPADVMPAPVVEPAPTQRN